MTTTIQVSESTRQALQMLKEKERAASYDEVLARLLQETGSVASSRFGSSKKLPPYSEKDRMRLREEH